MALVGRDHFEVMVAAIWMDILGDAPLDLDDDFFAAGGDSLKATLFQTRLATSFDEEISMQQFFGAPTPRGIASALRGFRSTAGEGVITMRAEGPGQPLVLLPVGAGMGFLAGDVFDRPVFALEAVGVHGGSIGPSEIVDLVPILANRTMRIAGDGPIQLIGRCAGGLLALAVANELQRRGVGVAAVHLFDPAPAVDSMSLTEMTAVWVQDSVPDHLASVSASVSTPEELFDLLFDHGVEVLASSRLQFAQRVAAVVATQHAAMQYPFSPFRSGPVECPVVAYASIDNPVQVEVAKELYADINLRVVTLPVPEEGIFSSPVVPGLVADQLHAIDETDLDIASA